MNTILLKQIVREELKKLKEQAEMRQLPNQHTEALKKMADKLRVRVNVMPGRNNMRLDIITPGDQDATEDVFEKLIKMIEALGYDVDLGRSTRNIEDDGDRLYRPHITFA